MDWKLADAKTKLSEVLNLALLEGPQKITRRHDAFIVLSEGDYKKLTGEKVSFSQMLLSIPKIDDLDLVRDNSPVRDFESLGVMLSNT